MPHGDNAADIGQSSTSPGARREHWKDAYAALRKMAAFRLASIPRGPTFQPTDVLHEAFVRILESESRAKAMVEPKALMPGAWDGLDEARAVATLAAAIRSVLVDRVRRRDVRRRHHPRVAHQERSRTDERESGWELLALDDALHQLAVIDPRAARVVELRYFAGLSVEHTATLMGQAVSTTERDWRFAKAWLAERLGQRGIPAVSAASGDFQQNREGAGATCA
jgi:RNA polymerase sigma factor (TIGR02999 family)